jgi:hypothetical protein
MASGGHPSHAPMANRGERSEEAGAAVAEGGTSSGDQMRHGRSEEAPTAMVCGWWCRQVAGRHWCRPKGGGGGGRRLGRAYVND